MYLKFIKDYFEVMINFFLSDFKTKKNLLKCIKNYSKDKNHSVIFISHIMEEVAEICDNVLVMDNGKSVYFGRPENIFKIDKRIEDFGLEMPQISKIMAYINAEGYGEDRNIISIKKAKDQLIKLLKKTVSEIV